jgi:hypothetical protein
MRGCCGLTYDSDSELSNPLSSLLSNPLKLEMMAYFVRETPKKNGAGLFGWGWVKC